MLSPLQLGPIRLDLPVIQAALAGYSDWPMRVIASRLGAPFTLTEAMLPRFVVQISRGKKARRRLRITDGDGPCGAQLMGGEDEHLAEAARRLAEMGFQAVDINLACPVKKVLGRHRGGYLLGEPEQALAIVAQVRDALPPAVPVTVKLRRGLDDSAESRERFFAILDGVLQRGAAAVTVHGRTVRQRYEGHSSWAFLGKVKRHVGSAIVLGSGDLFTAQDCLDMLHRTGVDGVAAARGAIGNPWIFGQVRKLAAGKPASTPPLDEQREVIAEHYRLAEEAYGPERAGRVMRKVGIKYAKLHPEFQAVCDAFIAVRHPPDWHAVLAKWYS